MIIISFLIKITLIVELFTCRADFTLYWTSNLEQAAVYLVKKNESQLITKSATSPNYWFFANISPGHHCEKLLQLFLLKLTLFMFTSGSPLRKSREWDELASDIISETTCFFFKAGTECKRDVLLEAVAIQRVFLLFDTSISTKPDQKREKDQRSGPTSEKLKQGSHEGFLHHYYIRT